VTVSSVAIESTPHTCAIVLSRRFHAWIKLSVAVNFISASDAIIYQYLHFQMVSMCRERSRAFFNVQKLLDIE
jgi:hypothetical protein